MALSAATLATQLAAISGANEAAAITSWALAWQTYFIDAVTDNGVAFSSSSIFRGLCRGQMAGAMTGLSSPGQGAAKIQAGIIAWWDYLVANPASAFAGGSGMAKPADLTSIAANMAPIMANNQANSLSAAAACTALANQFHTDNAGGTIVIGGNTRSIA